MEIEVDNHTAGALKGIADSIRRLHRIIYLDESRISKRFGLTGPQNGVMRALHRHGPMSSADLSRELFMTASNMTGIVDRLEQKGLVARERTPEDRRISMIALTPEGHRLSRRLLDPVEELLFERLVDHDIAEIRRFDETLNRLAVIIGTEGCAGRGKNPETGERRTVN